MARFPCESNEYLPFNADEYGESELPPQVILPPIYEPFDFWQKEILAPRDARTADISGLTISEVKQFETINSALDAEKAPYDTPICIPSVGEPISRSVYALLSIILCDRKVDDSKNHMERMKRRRQKEQKEEKE